MQKRVENVYTILKDRKNVSFQPYEMRKMCQKMFRVKKGDNDGHILATALFMKRVYPFRNVYMYTNDKDLKSRCNHFDIYTNI